MSAAGSSDDESVRAAVVGYALLFALPAGVGIAAGTMRVTRAAPTDPVVALPALVAAAAVFAFVIVAATRGEADGRRS